jgi:hypothetical protein
VYVKNVANFKECYMYLALDHIKIALKCKRINCLTLNQWKWNIYFESFKKPIISFSNVIKVMLGLIEKNNLLKCKFFARQQNCSSLCDIWLPCKWLIKWQRNER